MSAIGIIQARTRSSRLPGKVLAPILDRPLLELLLCRVEAAPVEEWWVATSDEPEDDALAAQAAAWGARVYRGDAEDVLSRYVEIACEVGTRWIVRATGDNPFVDASLIEYLLRYAGFQAGALDLVTQPADALPLGYGVQIVRRDALLESADEIPDAEEFHRAHVLSWLMAKGAVRAAPRPTHWSPRPRWRWTVDTSVDLCAARAAFACFPSPTADYPAMVAALDSAPAVAELNLKVRQKRVEEG